MLTLFAPFARSGGSLAALGAALALALPAVPLAAQEIERQPDVSDPPPMRIAPPERAGRQMRVQPETMAEPRAPRFERPEPPAAAYMPPQRIDVPQSRPAARGGFGGDVIGRAQADVAEVAERPERRGDGRRGGGWGGGWGRGAPDQPVADGGSRRGPERGDWRGNRADGRPGGWQGDRQADRQPDRQPGWQADRPVVAQPDVRGNGWQGERRDGVGAVGRDARQNGWRDGRRDGWQGNGVAGRGNGWGDGVRDLDRRVRRDEWRDDRRGDWRRDDWRDGRRGDWRGDRGGGWRNDRRNWRRDDWRWGWNGRPGWDNRDFNRWNRGWRSNRSYDWFDFRRGNQFVFRPGPYYAPFRSHRYSRVDIGFFLDSLFFQPRFFINDPWAYHLPPAYGPYQWVRYYDDVVLVDIYTGEVVDVVHNFFW